jgi:hypothetical protein
VTLEGRCRVRVRSVHLSSQPPQEHYEALVEQLDYFAGGSSAATAREQEELAQRLLKVGAAAPEDAGKPWRSAGLGLPSPLLGVSGWMWTSSVARLLW